MQFCLNPFTHRLDAFEQDLPGGGDVEKLTGNAGGAIGADGAHNINIVGAGGTTVTGNPGTNTLTITTTVADLFWQTIGVSGALAVNNGYVCTAGAALSFSLPAVSAVGNMIAITLDGSTSWTITQGAGQSIRLGNLATTIGAGGSLASTARGDTIMMVCSIANLTWNIISVLGNITIV